MIYQFISLLILGLSVASLISYLAKLNNLIEPLFLVALIVVGLAYGATQVDSAKEIKVISIISVLIVIVGGIIGWM